MKVACTRSANCACAVLINFERECFLRMCWMFLFWYVLHAGKGSVSVFWLIFYYFRVFLFVYLVWRTWNWIEWDTLEWMWFMDVVNEYWINSDAIFFVILRWNFYLFNLEFLNFWKYYFGGKLHPIGPKWTQPLTQILKL